MKIWKPSRVQLSEAQDTIQAQKNLIDALNEHITALEHKNEALEALNRELNERLRRYDEGHVSSPSMIKALSEAWNALGRLEPKMKLIENGANEAWLLNVGKNPEIIKVRVRPNYLYCYQSEDVSRGGTVYVASPKNVFTSEEAALKALEKYLITGETPETVDN